MNTTTEPTVRFSETKTINGKTREIYFGYDEGECFRFARERNGYAYLFLPGVWRILIPVKTVIDQVKG